MMRHYFLRSTRLGFSTWSVNDLPLADGLWGDAEVTRYHGGHWGPQQIKDRLALEIASLQAHGVQYWPLFLLNNGEHVGCCGLHSREGFEGGFELGCHLRRSHWSQKLGREAARAVVAYAFDHLGAVALFAGHHPSNLASRRFLQYLGFRFTHDEFYPPTQLIEPCYELSPSTFNRTDFPPIAGH